MMVARAFELEVTSAMRAGLAHTGWTIEDMVRRVKAKAILDGLKRIA